MSDYTEFEAQRAVAYLRHSAEDWSQERKSEALRRFHERRKGQQKHRRILAYSVAPLLAVAGVSLWWTFSDPSHSGLLESDSQGNAVQTAPKNDTPVNSAPLLVPKGERQGQGTVQFVDGTVARLLDSDAEFVLREAPEGEVHVELVGGSAAFDVQPQGKGRFVLLAGGVSVRVVHAGFVVKRSEDRVHVSVERGVVEVSAESGGRRLVAGEAGWFAQRTVRSALTSSNREKAVQDTPATSAPARQIKAQRSEFVKLHQSAQYGQAYKLLKESKEQLGTGDEHWMRAADAARYSGHATEAVTYLKRVNEAGASGSTAAFILGRLYHYELGQPGLAAVHYARAQKLSPSGPMAEDALFREIECRAASGNALAASERAKSFLKRYPGSSRESQVAAYVLTP